MKSSGQPVVVRVQRSRRAEQQSTLEQRAVEFMAFEETLEDLDQIALQMARDETVVAPETVIGEKNRRRASRNRERYVKEQQSSEEHNHGLSYVEQLEEAAKQVAGSSEALKCSSCRQLVDWDTQGSVAMETIKTRATMLGPAPGGIIEWTEDGQAVLHRSCFDRIGQATGDMSLAARKRFGAALSGAEFFDPLDVVRSAALKLAKCIRRSGHCVVMTAAGISTAAGVPDFCGRSGKCCDCRKQMWNEVCAVLKGRGAGSVQGSRHLIEYVMNCSALH